MTRFVVLAQIQAPRDPAWQGWQEHSEQEAHSAEAAIKAAYMKSSDQVLAMVAVPARSWRPQTIRTETVKRVVLGAAGEDTPKDAA